MEREMISKEIKVPLKEKACVQHTSAVKHRSVSIENIQINAIFWRLVDQAFLVHRQ